MTDREMFLRRAEEARAEADLATLDNVRDRCLRAAGAWSTMAQRAGRMEEQRKQILIDKLRRATTEQPEQI